MLTTKHESKGVTEARGADLLAPRRIVLHRRSGAHPVAGYIVALVGSAALAATFRPFRASLTPLSEAFAFLTLVVVVAWIGGLGPGVFASILAFITFNFFFLPPYDTFIIERPEYIVILFVQLGISVLISSLLGRTRVRVEQAEARETELRALQDLSAELVGRVPGPEAYAAVLARLMELLVFSGASLFVADEDARGQLREEATVGVAPGTFDPASMETGVERLPLTLGRNRLGMLLLHGDRPSLGPGESRVLRAFCDQLALVLERDRLLRVAAKAETYRSAEKLRRALLTAVSHDLRSPLSAIKASVTDLLDDGAPADPGYRHDVLSSIDQEVDRLNSLIANLLDMSRIEAGMLQAHIQTVDSDEVIARCIDRARRRWPAVQITANSDQRAALVRADPVYLERVVTNLLDNAARSTFEAGRDGIEVETRARDGGATAIRVVDHGKGVTSMVREHLFTPFYDLNERSARLGPGIGLAICKGFLDAMRGEIWVEETPGGGATFAISLASGGTR